MDRNAKREKLEEERQAAVGTAKEAMTHQLERAAHEASSEPRVDGRIEDHLKVARLRGGKVHIDDDWGDNNGICRGGGSLRLARALHSGWAVHE